MPRLVDVTSNFTGGQLDPKVQARTDLDLYLKSFKELRNVCMRITGGIDKRPGLEYITRLDVSLGINDHHDIRFYPFLFNDDQRYIVFAQEGELDVVAVDGTACSVTNGTTEWPHLEAEMKDVKVTQQGDTMILFHKNHQPRLLLRTGATTFTLNKFEFSFENVTSSGSTTRSYKNCPMLPLRFDKGMDVIAVNYRGAATNSARITAVKSNTFKTSDVGKRFYIEDGYFVCDSFVTDQVIDGHFLSKAEDFWDIPMTNAANFYTIGETIVQGSAATGGPFDRAKLEIFRFYIDGNGLVGRRTNDIAPVVTNTFKGLQSEVQLAPLSAGVSVTSSYVREYWTEEVYNDDNGWPACGVFHEGRLWIAGGDPAPYHVFGSQSGDYFNFSVGEGLPNEGIAVPCLTDNLAEIIHLHSADNLQAFTNAGMLYAPSTEDVPLAPDNMRFLPQNKYGVSHLPPHVFDRATISIQENNKTVRENAYDVTAQKIESSPISMTASDLLTNIVDSTVSYGLNERDEQYALFLNEDGSMAVFHSTRDENIRAWVPWSFPLSGNGGLIKQICSVGNEIFALVESDTTYLADFYNYHLVKLNFNTHLDMFSELTYVGAGIGYTTWKVNYTYSSEEFEGRTVAVIMDDGAGDENAYYLGEFPVATTTGYINIPIDSSYSGRTLKAGWLYDSRIVPLPLTRVLAEGDVLVDVKHVSAITLDLLNTMHIKVDGQDLDPLILFDDLDEVPVKFSGLRKFYLMGWDYRQDIEIIHSIPIPFELLALTREVEI